MAIIHIASTGESVHVPDGSMLKASARYLDTPMVCSVGACGSCPLRVLAGKENLTPATERETRRLQKLNAPEARLACQTKIEGGEVTIIRHMPSDNLFSGLSAPKFPAIQALRAEAMVGAEAS